MSEDIERKNSDKYPNLKRLQPSKNSYMMGMLFKEQ